jgi:hypothetical protein
MHYQQTIVMSMATHTTFQLFHIKYEVFLMMTCHLWNTCCIMERIVSGSLGGIWEGVIMAYFRFLSQILSGGA